jgi:hypothetical protein
MADDQKTPLDQVLDVFVYAPLGLALTAKDELPKLIEKGRTRTTSQLMMAKMIGQFAVTQGRQEIERRLERMATPPPPPAAPAPPPAPAPADAPVVLAHEHSTNGTNGGAPTRPVGPPADSLAIPGYDSLSAPQVVQRLAGLAPEELEAVAAYEEANRGRRTILSKVSMLQAERG